MAVVFITVSKEEVRLSSIRSKQSVKGWTVHSGGLLFSPSVARKVSGEFF